MFSEFIRLRDSVEFDLWQEERDRRRTFEDLGVNDMRREVKDAAEHGNKA